jgi:hypothetical protein
MFKFPEISQVRQACIGDLLSPEFQIAQVAKLPDVLHSGGGDSSIETDVEFFDSRQIANRRKVGVRNICSVNQNYSHGVKGVQSVLPNELSKPVWPECYGLDSPSESANLLFRSLLPNGAHGDLNADNGD